MLKIFVSFLTKLHPFHLIIYTSSWKDTQNKICFFFTQISIECWCHDVVYGRIERRGWSISASDLSHKLGSRRFSRSNTEKYDKIIFKFSLSPPPWISPGFHQDRVRKFSNLGCWCKNGLGDVPQVGNPQLWTQLWLHPGWQRSVSFYSVWDTSLGNSASWTHPEFVPLSDPLVELLSMWQESLARSSCSRFQT